jgi:nitrate/nitrite transporter NarK
MSYGIFNLLGFGVGSLATPVAGYIADHYGFERIFMFLSMVVLLNCVVCGWLYRRVSRRL